MYALQFLRAAAIIALFGRHFSGNFSFTQEATAQHADMWVAALQTMQESVPKHVSSAMHALCCRQ